MDVRRNILMENFTEYFESAEKALLEEKYNSAVTLYFKSMVALADIFIFDKEGYVPSSYKNRFQILKKEVL